MLHPLYFVLVFTVECGFTRWYIWFSSTLTPKGFKSHAAPVLKICFWLYVTKIKVTYIMPFFKSLKWNYFWMFWQWASLISDESIHLCKNESKAHMKTQIIMFLQTQCTFSVRDIYWYSTIDLNYIFFPSNLHLH